MAEGSPGLVSKISRVTKRIRSSEDLNADCDEELTPLVNLEPAVDTTSVSPPFLKNGSFRDRLMNHVNLTKNTGIAVDSLEVDYVDLTDEDDVKISCGTRGPSIQFSDRAMTRFCQPWKNALIIKLLGRSHTYNYLRDRLQQKWNLKGQWKLVDLVNDYFVVQFDLEEDLNYVLTEGPWIISGQYLTLQKWRTGFCPATAHITRMAAWIRVSAIQLECFDVWALKRIGNLLGKLLKIDALTTSQNRGKFARLCIELDMTKPLDAFIQINQIWYNIEYEGLPDICYHCGLYGHKSDSCTQRRKPTTVMPEGNQSDPSGEQVGQDTNMEKESGEEVVENLRGPWMNVPPRRKTKTGAKIWGGESNSLNPQGSRFDALEKITEEFGTETAEAFVDVIPTNMVTSKMNYDAGVKIWTKSNKAKGGGRPAVKDNSNRSMASSSRGATDQQKKVNPKDNTQTVKSNKGKLNSSMLHPSDAVSVCDKFSEWVRNQNVQTTKGDFIFGHQPPNITDGHDRLVNERVADKLFDALTSEATDSFCPVEGMDLAEGQDHTIGKEGFFHISTIVRRRRNKIEKLMNNVGVWVEEAIELKDLAVDYFMGLFCANQPDNANLPMPKLFPSLREDELNPLVASIDINEVKESLFNIGSLKTPGVDGFPACFYQNQWQLCGNDIFNLVTEAFKECRIPEGLNATLVTLIPKIDNPMSMIHFRPISLCCTLYKVISKVIVARLRPLLAKLVSPHQVSFIPGRHLSDNILIAQELMFKFRNTKRKKGFIAWKIDLSKAYDRLNWGFIMTVLKEVGFPENLIQLIIHCVSSVTYQVCVNGELTETFTPKNGIRQGDPLSPYLFVLCMEKFSHLIVEAVKNFNWKPVKSSQGGPFVSHLFFADDLILFAEATPRQAHIMKQCLDEFCRASGQVVNFEKSAIYCSPNISKELASDISHICGSPLTNNLGKYLGMPLLHSRVTKSTYNNLVDKVHARLASWKSRVLSSAGRATLIQAVTSAIPVFAMQTAKLPMSICDEPDKLNRNFFWGGSDKKTKVHLCQWDLLCRPKSKGGLGFKKTHEMNKALLAKSGWRLLKKDEGLWAQIFEKKYLRGHSPCDPNLLLKQNCSPTWKGIVFGSQLLEKGLIWRLGKGDNINFWKDKWIADEALIHMVEVSPDSSVDTIVSDFLMDGWWDIEKLRRVLPEDWVQKIIGCPADLGGTTEDCQIWQTTSNGLFSVKTAYNLLFSGTEWLNPWWKVLWKLKLPPKILFFFWLAYQGKIMSNEQRARRLFIGDPACCICDWHSESTLHILRDCTRAKRVWNLFLNSNQYAPFFHAELHPWLLSNFCSKNMFLQIPWKTLFGVICWHLWKWRNDFIFNNKDDLPFNPRELILSATKEWIKASTNNQLGGDKIQVSLAWTPPENGVLKLNVDGSLMKSSGSIGAGGVIRDHLGNWIGGFAVNLGKGQILEAELWGLFFGLKLAITRGIMDIIVEMDSVNAVNLILSNDLNICHPMAGLVSSCKRLLRQIPKCFLHHIYREKNAVADRLAAWSHDIDLGCWFLEDNPTWLGPLLLDDSIGVTKTRIISSV
ncbi:hypothetical protein L3X38_005096 [Prunus dulcis]|uniref:Reverse transcriptase n=1 Tax=Prunus dulcis TaxID=3755 RepID=A0AAD5F3W6_PRUDU|nr:hypothetical protein L3X38_005096 [Prunus dulcis]